MTECVAPADQARSTSRVSRGRHDAGRRPACRSSASTSGCFDDDDNEVPWDGVTPGEICARSNHVMIGYWNAPEETASRARGGWLHTGDLAVVARRLPHDRRPQEGPHRLGRREHRVGRGREGARGAPRGPRGRRRRRARRALGRGAPRVRHAARGCRQRRPTSSSGACANGSPTSRRRKRCASSTRSPGAAPARS